MNKKVVYFASTQGDSRSARKLTHARARQDSPSRNVVYFGPETNDGLKDLVAELDSERGASIAVVSKEPADLARTLIHMNCRIRDNCEFVDLGKVS